MSLLSNNPLTQQPQPSPWRVRGNRRRHSRLAFTIVEMMIAMAITLLMMAALGRAFKLIGDSMQTSRTNVELSSRLRTISFRIKDELARVTAKMAPPRAGNLGEGYFCYYDGPMTDASTIQAAVVGDLQQGGVKGISRDNSQAAITSYFPLSRFGDLDDYLAFTAIAEDDTPFRGIVPYFVIAYKERELANAEAARTGAPLLPYPPTTTELPETLAMQPVVIASKYAEIVYWLSPARHVDVPANDPKYLQIIDNDGDSMPDFMHLRRRVLLIRPDLNSTTGAFAGTLPTYPNSTAPALPHLSIGSGLRPLTEIYQICDLAVRRPVNTIGVPLPTSNRSAVIANSLSDLSLPQNRFAHVRVPEQTAPLNADFNGNGNVDFTSMPVLDLNGPEGFMAAVLNNIDPVSGSTRFHGVNGFLNYAYELVGSRLGEDIVLSNVVGFDVRGYDDQAPVLIHVGPNGSPGDAGDDDNDGGADWNDFDSSEFGTLGTDDAIITPNDPGFYTAIRSQIRTTATTGGQQPVYLAARGAFVDLNYVYKAAGNVMAPVGMDSGAGGSPFTRNVIDFCQTPLSGFANGSPINALGWMVPENLLRSGKLVLGPPSGNRRPALINQVTYDTWSSDYEHDRHNQGMLFGGNPLGTVFVFDGLADTYDPTYAGAIPDGYSWPNQVDEATNGIDEIGTGAGIDDPTEWEAPPPIAYNLPSVQVRIRVIDYTSQGMRQTSIAQFFEQ